MEAALAGGFFGWVFFFFAVFLNKTPSSEHSISNYCNSGKTFEEMFVRSQQTQGKIDLGK